MKRILALVLILIFSLQITAFAEVVRRPKDSFDNSVTIISGNEKVGSFDELGLGKVIYPSKYIYGLAIIKPCTYKPDVFYQMNRVQIKIDDQIFDTSINNQAQNVKKGEFVVYGQITMKIALEENLITLLKNANKVTIRTTDNQGFNTTVELPESVLAEWKQVINTEK